MKSTSAISVAMVADLATQVEVSIQRLAPSWGWFMTAVDKSKKLFARNNAEAYAKLQEIAAERAAPKKPLKLQLWHCNKLAGLVLTGRGLLTSQLPALAACATSRAAVIRILDEHYHCGPGTDRASFRYRVKKYWSKGWPTPMLAVTQEPGLWEINTQKKVA